MATSFWPQSIRAVNSTVHFGLSVGLRSGSWMRKPVRISSGGICGSGFGGGRQLAGGQVVPPAAGEVRRPAVVDVRLVDALDVGGVDERRQPARRLDDAERFAAGQRGPVGVGEHHLRQARPELVGVERDVIVDDGVEAGDAALEPSVVGLQADVASG